MNEQLIRRVRRSIERVWPYRVSDEQIRRAIELEQTFPMSRRMLVVLVSNRLAPARASGRPIPFVSER